MIFNSNCGSWSLITLGRKCFSWTEESSRKAVLCYKEFHSEITTSWGDLLRFPGFMTFNIGPQHKMVFHIFWVPSLPVSISILYFSQLGPQKSVTTLNTRPTWVEVKFQQAKHLTCCLNVLCSKAAHKALISRKACSFHSTPTRNSPHFAQRNGQIQPITDSYSEDTTDSTYNKDTFKIPALKGSKYSDSALQGCNIAQTVRYLPMFRDWTMSQPNGSRQYKIHLLAYYAVSNNREFPKFRRIVQPPSSRPSPHSFRVTIWYLPTPKKTWPSGPPLRKLRILHECSQVQ